MGARMSAGGSARVDASGSVRVGARDSARVGARMGARVSARAGARVGTRGVRVEVGVKTGTEGKLHEAGCQGSQGRKHREMRPGGTGFGREVAEKLAVFLLDMLKETW